MKFQPGNFQVIAQIVSSFFQFLGIFLQKDKLTKCFSVTLTEQMQASLQ